MRIASLAPVKLLIPAIPLVTLAVVAVESATPEQAAQQRATPTVVEPVKRQPLPPPPRDTCDPRCMAPAPK